VIPQIFTSHQACGCGGGISAWPSSPASAALIIRVEKQPALGESNEFFKGGDGFHSSDWLAV
jgi:hypothetical protein